MFWAAVAVAASLVLCARPAAAQSVQLVPFGGQSFNTPYFVASPPGDPGRVFVVEGTGTIRLVKDGVTRPTPFLSINADVLFGGEAGMLSMAFAPDYASSGRFYVFYTRNDPTPGNEHFLRIEEFHRSAGNPDVADLGTRRIVLEIPHFTSVSHNGGQLQFGPDKLLYISTGDGGNTPEQAQSLTTRLGKLLRIDPRGGAPGQYSVPADNPYADGPGPNADEIYAHGLRNPYRFSFDRATGDLTVGDVGANIFEEVDFKPEGSARGANFGWPCYEGSALNSTSGPCSRTLTNHSPPVLQYANPPSGSAAVNGGYVIRDSSLPSLGGRYIYADTFGAVPGVRTALLSAGGASGDASLGFSAATPVSFGQDACGHIYVAEIGGRVYRLQPTSGGFPCKLAPKLKLKTKQARNAAKRGAIVLKVSCDEDCDISGDGLIKIAGARKKLKADADGGRVEVGSQLRLKLDLSQGQSKRLRRALDAGRKAKAKIKVSATGGGGGTDTEKRKVKQKG